MNITSSKGLNYIESYVKDGRTMIDFTCENHKDKGVQSFSITQMRNTKFGCKYCNMSKYLNEEKIDSLLKSWNILFKRQHSFQKCRDKNALPLIFIYQNIILQLSIKANNIIKLSSVEA